MEQYMNVTATTELLAKDVPGAHVIVFLCVFLYSLFQLANSIVKNSILLIEYLKAYRASKRAAAIQIDPKLVDKFKDL
jgi:hypothetical protein